MRQIRQTPVYSEARQLKTHCGCGRGLWCAEEASAIAQELKDAFEDELMRKDVASAFEAGMAILKAKR